MLIYLLLADRSVEILADRGIAARAFERGLIVYPSGGCANGTYGDVVMVAPPFVVTDHELQELAAALDASLSDLAL